MEHQKHRQNIGDIDYAKYFPFHRFPQMRSVQREGFQVIRDNDGRAILELPVGSGKTAIGYAFLKALAAAGQGPLFYVVPTKALVDQVCTMFPDLVPAYGRNEHLCLYYPDEQLRADEIPCLWLNCEHRVNVETGVVQGAGATPCPFYQQMYKARQSKIVVCTMAFYLFHQLFNVGRTWDEAAGLVLDEAHAFPDVVRRCLSYEISDYHLGRCAGMLSGLDAEVATQLSRFQRTLVRIVKRKPAGRQTLLEDHEIRELLEVLEEIDAGRLESKLRQAIGQGLVDPKVHREELKQLEVIIRDLRRYVHSLGYSLSKGDRKPLDYTFAYYEEESGESARKRYRLFIKSYYVAPLIRRVLAPRTVAYSATIGDHRIFEWVSGMKAPMYSLGSDFPCENTRIYLPTDTPNLAHNARNRQDLNRSLRSILRACKKLARSGHRSLVVVVSEVERKKFLEFCAEEGVDARSYGNGVAAKEAAAKFRDGAGDVLVGTVAQYGEGVDLPEQRAPVIFMLRPGYASPYDPQSQFEERRFQRGQLWALRRWEVMMEALQVRGRNIRSATDRGVTIFVSQQYGKFLQASLPKWLESAYRKDRTFEQCVEDTLEFLESDDVATTGTTGK